ncbi:uncharacterized protein ALTATR162_LOCUS4187 [Alternaria atra]|uniref:Uncharacterized protein n=1 Tax=Alternaria atra TaxID=119953 RepID=A0A8J2I7U7_9PLEO|nr:uncharacterized protein ALTATR162_LOCUS4187 [Alternaria atra]CAG5156389.1 unnamed protein product [Alternaria atra]
MFAGLNGIGADIANRQLGNDTPEQQARRVNRELRNLADPHVLRAPRMEQQRSPIVIDSDSDDADYEAHLQDFEDFRRDIADIRSRAPYRHVSRSSRRRRVIGRTGNNRNENGDADVGAVSSSNSDNVTATPGLRRTNTHARGSSSTPGTSAFNRFLNNRRTLNPFRPASENNAAATPRPAGNPLEQQREGSAEAALVKYLLDQHERAVEPVPTRQLANLRRHARERQANVQAYMPSIEPNPPHPSEPGASRATTLHAHLPSSNTSETPIDIDMTSDKLTELPAIQPLPAREAIRSRQLDHREGNLNRREQAMAMRQTILARREVELTSRETRVDELMRVVRRHREEAEKLVRRHRKEIEELLN